MFGEFRDAISAAGRKAQSFTGGKWRIYMPLWKQLTARTELGLFVLFLLVFLAVIG